jgi:hypothetical protein
MKVISPSRPLFDRHRPRLTHLEGGGSELGSFRHHHRLKTHIAGWRVEQHPDDLVTWTTPTGNIYTSHPYDYDPNRPHRPRSISDTGPGLDPDPPPF